MMRAAAEPNASEHQNQENMPANSSEIIYPPGQHQYVPPHFQEGRRRAEEALRFQGYYGRYALPPYGK